MAATVHGASRFGITDDATATGLLLGDLSFDYSVDVVYAKNHIGQNVSMALLNDVTEVSCSGVVAVKATGLTVDLGDAITLANSTVDSLAPLSQNLMATPISGAGTVITGASLKRMNGDFETGDIKCIYNPQISVAAPVTVT